MSSGMLIWSADGALQVRSEGQRGAQCMIEYCIEYPQTLTYNFYAMLGVFNYNETIFSRAARVPGPSSRPSGDIYAVCVIPC